MIALPGSIVRTLALQSLRGEDEALFWSLDDKWQAYVLSFFEIFNELARARNINAAADELAERNAHLSISPKAQPGYGYSAKTIKNLWRAYRHSGDWKVLLKAYKGPKDPQPLAFIGFLRTEVEKNNRVARPVYSQIRRDWAAGQSIAGYGTWRERWKAVHGDPVPDEFPEDFFPKGWDDRNLDRYVRKAGSDAQLVLARDGHKAAHELMPQIERTTFGALPLQGVIFDDVRTDWLVIVPGCAHPVELSLLVAMDIATRKIIAWVAKAYLTDDDGKRQELLRRDMRQLVGMVLQLGLPEGYAVRLVVENAKATISDSERATLRQLFGDRVDVRSSGMTHKTVLPGGYCETSGQPWFKAPLESFFNLFHNELAALPGQTGASYALAPGELDARKKAAKALLKAAAEADLSAETIRQLKAPFLHYHEAIDALTAVFDLLNTRMEHDLEGFEKRAFFRFSPAEKYRPIDELARYDRATIKRAMIKHRVESPNERWNRLLAGVRLEPVSELALLPYLARSVAGVSVYKPYHVKIGGVVYRAEEPRLALERREEFCARILENDPSVAHLFDARGKHVCAVRTTEKVGWFDDAAYVDAFAEQKHFAALIETPVRERHADQEGAREAAQAHNDALIANAGRAGAAMVQSAAQVKREARKLTAAQVKKNALRAAQIAQLAERQRDGA